MRVPLGKTTRMVLIPLALLVLAATSGTIPPAARATSDAPPSPPSQSSSPGATVLRHRRGDPSKTLAAAPQVFVAVPPQISADDLKHWCWILGQAELAQDGVTAAFDAYVQRNDALRTGSLPGIFAGAIAAASPPGNWSAEQARDAARSIEKARIKFLADEAVGDRELFDELARLSGGSIDPEELAALRVRDVARLYPDTLAAARADVGRMIHSMASAAAISEDSAKLAVLILRGALSAEAAACAKHVRTTSELLADGCLPELLQGVASSGRQVAAPELEGAQTRSRNAHRNFAASSERLAKQNLSAIDDIAAGLTEQDATTVRRRFGAEVYGILADPPLQSDALIALIARIPDAAARADVEAAAREWIASNQLRQREARAIFDEYKLRQIESSRQDRDRWTRTASRISDLHAESERALLPIAAAIVAALDAGTAKAVQSQLDSLTSAGRDRSSKQVDSIDPAFASTRIDPTREGIRVGKPVDIKAAQQDRREAPSPGTEGPPSGGTP
jgi:hypothetical protein